MRVAYLHHEVNELLFQSRHPDHSSCLERVLPVVVTYRVDSIQVKKVGSLKEELVSAIRLEWEVCRERVRVTGTSSHFGVVVVVQYLYSINMALV